MNKTYLFALAAGLLVGYFMTDSIVGMTPFKQAFKIGAGV